LRWRSRVDLEEKCCSGPVREWLQPGIGHGRRSIIVSVASRGGGLVCGWKGVKAPLGGCCEDCRECNFRSDVIGGIVDNLVEFVSACCRTDANVRAQEGLVEKSGSGMCVCWNTGHVCWGGVRSVVPRKRLGHCSQQRVHPMELRILSGSSRKMLECSCSVYLERLEAVSRYHIVQVKNHIWDRAQNRTTFGTGGFVVIKSDVAGHFESYKARILPLYVRRASMCDTNLD